MLNKITQHIPNFVDTDQPLYVAHFTTLEELLEISFVKSWRARWNGHRDFWRFALDGTLLVAEFDNGEFWWVVGRLLHSDDIDLPQPKYREKRTRTAL